MEALLYSIETLFPVYVLILLGFLFRRKGFLDEAFIRTGTKLLFNVAMPILLFLNLLDTDLSHTFEWRLLVYAFAGTTLFYVALRIIVPRFLKDPAVSSAFIQGSFRGNLLIMGMPIVFALAGNEGIAKLGMVLTLMAPYNTIASVLILSRAGGEMKRQLMIKEVLLNPLFLACIAGVAGSLVGLHLPELLRTPLDHLADLTLPLSLLTLGANIHFRGEETNIRRAVSASLLKVAVFPLVMIPLSVMLGLRGADLAVMLVIFGAPAASSSFPMAYQMGADHKLASLIIVFTHVLCLPVMFCFIFVLRFMGWL